MQRRAIRDAKTPDKMKKSKFVKEDNNLTLQEKKEKIQSGLKKLTELGTVDPKNRYQELINDIARVLHVGHVDGLAEFKAVSEARKETMAVQMTASRLQFMGKLVSSPAELFLICSTRTLPAP